MMTNTIATHSIMTLSTRLSLTIHSIKRFSIMTNTIATDGIMALTIMAQGITIHSITTLSIKTHSITALRIAVKRHKIKGMLSVAILLNTGCH
jgi:hypothetical protein